jgi:hypothetical protein
MSDGFEQKRANDFDPIWRAPYSGALSGHVALNRLTQG